MEYVSKGRDSKYPWFSYSIIWFSLEFGECVFQKRHGLSDGNKVISWKNVSKMEDTKRSLAGCRSEGDSPAGGQFVCVSDSGLVQPHSAVVFPKQH